MMNNDMHAAERWAKRFLPRPQARLRLFCFPYAGAGASALRRWMGLFPGEIEVRPIEYPGRWTRQGEPLCANVAALAEGAAATLTPLLDRPFAVLGYSLGALVAFEWVRRLEGAGQPRPTVFFACAQRAPHLPPRQPFLSALPDRELLPAMEARYGASPGPALDDPDLLAMVLPPLRADLRARETYRYQPGPPLATPIQAFGGTDDAATPAADLAGWRDHTRGGCGQRLFPGGHFFIATAGEALKDAIVAQLPAALL